MGLKDLVGFVMLLVSIGVAVGGYFYFKSKGSKVGLAVAIVFSAFVGLVVFGNTIDGLLTSKSDIVSDFKALEIQLEDDFQINYSTVSGMSARVQETELRISTADKARIIARIEAAPNFRAYANSQELMDDDSTDRFGMSGDIFNFKYQKSYSRETYARVDDYPARLFVRLDEDSNILKYRRIEN